MKGKYTGLAFSIEGIDRGRASSGVLKKEADGSVHLFATVEWTYNPVAQGWVGKTFVVTGKDDKGKPVAEKRELKAAENKATGQANFGPA